jgi:hypothetical protein
MLVEDLRRGIVVAAGELIVELLLGRIAGDEVTDADAKNRAAHGLDAQHDDRTLDAGDAIAKAFVALAAEPQDACGEGGVALDDRGNVVHLHIAPAADADDACSDGGKRGQRVDAFEDQLHLTCRRRPAVVRHASEVEDGSGSRHHAGSLLGSGAVGLIFVMRRGSACGFDAQQVAHAAGKFGE